MNRYQPGEGIMHHTDGPLYFDRVVILSFGAPAVMSFRPRLSSENIGVSKNPSHTETSAAVLNNDINILLQPNSLLFFSDGAYSSYLHCLGHNV